MKTSSALIVAGGSIPPYRLISQLADSSQLVIAADRGATFCRGLDVMPDVLIGDFDSIEFADLEFFRSRTEIYQYPRDKDFTDLELAIFYAERSGVKECSILAWADERIDYSLCALYAASRTFLKTTLYSHRSEIHVLNKHWPELTLDLGLGTKCSFYPLEAPTTLEATGLKWPLSWKHVNPRVFSQSNEVDDRLSVQLMEGSAYVLVEKNFV